MQRQKDMSFYPGEAHGPVIETVTKTNVLGMNHGSQTEMRVQYMLFVFIFLKGD